MAELEVKGFFSTLFDLSFSEFITTRIIKYLYVLAIILAALGTLAGLIKGLTSGIGPAILSIVLAPIFFFLYVVMARVWLELIIVAFRIAENSSRLVTLVERKTESN